MVNGDMNMTMTSKLFFGSFKLPNPGAALSGERQFGEFKRL